MRHERDLNEGIRELRDGGASFPKRASSVHIPHEAVRKRLRGPEGRDRLSTQKPPSLSPNGAVKPPQRLHKDPYRGKEAASQKVPSAVDDLLLFIRDSLESRGIELYSMESHAYEAYQARHKGQIVRLYIKQNKEETG